MVAKFLKEEHHIFREGLVKFIEKEVKPYFEQWENERLIPRELWNKLGENGYLCSWADEKYGGYNADFGYAVILAEELERVGTGLLGITLHSDIVVPYINSFGNEEQKAQWIPNCVKGNTITAIAMTEPGTGSDLAGIKTTAIRDGDYYILNGEKTFISNGIQSDLIFVVCKTDPKATPRHRGISIIAVERDTPGFFRGKKLDKVGLHSQDTAELRFEDCRVPVEHLLGEEGKGFYYLMDKLQQERLLCSIQAQVSSEEMLSMTIDYVKSRKAFGTAISKFQNTQFKLAEMATEVAIGRSFLNELISDHIEGKNIVTKVSMAKWWITERAKRIAAECMQLHGGYGYMEEYPIARKFRDIAVSSIYAGTNEVMKTIIAKNLEL